MSCPVTTSKKKMGAPWRNEAMARRVVRYQVVGFGLRSSKPFWCQYG